MTITELRELIGMLSGYVWGSHVVDWIVMGFCVSVVVALITIQQRRTQ